MKFKTVVLFVLAAVLMNSSYVYAQKIVTPQVLYLSWGNNPDNQLRSAGNKGSMYGFLHDGTKSAIAAKFGPDGQWLEGSVIIPLDILSNPQLICRRMISIQYLSAMASFGLFTQSISGPVDDFVNKTLDLNSVETWNKYIICTKSVKVIGGSKVVQFDFHRR